MGAEIRARHGVLPVDDVIEQEPFMNAAVHSPC